MDDKIIAALWPSSTIDTSKTATPTQKPTEGADSKFASMVKGDQNDAVTVKADNMVSALRQVEEIAQTKGTDALVNIQMANNEASSDEITVKANAHEAASALYGQWKDK